MKQKKELSALTKGKELTDDELQNVIGGMTDQIGPDLYKYEAADGSVIVFNSKTHTLYTFATSEEFYNSKFS